MKAKLVGLGYGLIVLTLIGAYFWPQETATIWRYAAAQIGTFFGTLFGVSGPVPPGGTA